MIEALGQAVERQQDRLFLWVPVFFGGGIGIYFSLHDEPAIAPLLTVFVAVTILALSWRRGLAGLVIPGALFWLCAGLVAAKLASDRQAAPIVTRTLTHAALAGWVELVEPRIGGARRITLRLASLQHRQYRGPPPDRVRVRIPGGEPALAPGDAVRFRATLLPPGRPALPEAYDFARQAWFMRLGGVGYTRAPPQIMQPHSPPPLDLRLWAPVERLRQHIGTRITAALPGESGAIATALITGDRGGVSQATTDAYRDAGIVHILSISGLHMTIFAGAVYVFIRFVLALIPTFALRFPIKKWAATAGLAGTLGYLLISGFSPPAVRSALMIAVMFGAILLDRPALALRNIAIAALLILLATPQSLIDVGFQMSFAAVAALVAGAEAHREWRQTRPERDEHQNRGAIARAALFTGGIVATTLLATAAVAPLAAYHFHKATQYGVLANMAAIPICNFLVMPAALATLVSLPFGLEVWPLKVMGWAIDAMTLVALRVAGLPGAAVTLPEISQPAFLTMMAGGIWLALIAGHARHLGWLAVAAGLVLAPLRTPPDVLVSESGRLVALRGIDGRYAALNGDRADYELTRWLEHDGDGRKAADVGPGPTFVCDALGCTARVRGQSIAISEHAAGLPDDCTTAQLLIWLGTAHPGCPASTPVITRTDLATYGTHAIRIGATPVTYGGRLAASIRGKPKRSTEWSHPKPGHQPIVIETVEGHRGNRPWTQRTAAPLVGRSPRGKVRGAANQPQ